MKLQSVMAVIEKLLSVELGLWDGLILLEEGQNFKYIRTAFFQLKNNFYWYLAVLLINSGETLDILV